MRKNDPSQRQGAGPANPIPPERMLKEDSFPTEVYTEPVRIIVNLALENRISPSGYLWMMMGMFAMIYQKSSMSPEKKRILMTEIQRYIPLMKAGDRRKQQV